MYSVHLRGDSVKVYSVFMVYPAKIRREAILEAAARMLEEGGLESVSIRGLASRLGVVPNALYRYFHHLEELQAALSNEAARRLLGDMEGVAGGKDAEAALRAMCDSYVRFAAEQRHWYTALMTRCERSMEDSTWHVRLWEYIVGYVGQLSGAEKAAEGAVALWAFLHGMAALEEAGVFRAGKPATSYEWGLEAWFARARQVPSLRDSGDGRGGLPSAEALG